MLLDSERSSHIFGHISEKSLMTQTAMLDIVVLSKIVLTLLLQKFFHFDLWMLWFFVISLHIYDFGTWAHGFGTDIHASWLFLASSSASVYVFLGLFQRCLPVVIPPNLEKVLYFVRRISILLAWLLSLRGCFPCVVFFLAYLPRHSARYGLGVLSFWSGPCDHYI